MTQPEYEQQKRECWEKFCDEHLFDPHNIITQGIFGYAFDRAYALGKQEKDAEKPKRMCLRDKSKVCNRCHECDIDPDLWHSMYSH